MKIINILDSWVITILLREDKGEFTDRFVKGANKKCRNIENEKNILEKGRRERKLEKEKKETEAEKNWRSVDNIREMGKIRKEDQRKGEKNGEVKKGEKWKKRIGKRGTGRKEKKELGGAKREKRNICLYPSYF